MKLLTNAGSDRVIDILKAALAQGGSLDAIAPSLSLFAYEPLAKTLAALARARLIVPADLTIADLLGDASDRPARNRLQTRYLAARLRAWLAEKVDVRLATTRIPQGVLVARAPDGTAKTTTMGSLALTTPGLGLTPPNQLSLIHASETPAEAAQLSAWFDAQWASLPATPKATKATTNPLLSALATLAAPVAPATAYTAIIHHLFAASGDTFDEDTILKSGTGIRNTLVWKKLYKFQRDGAIGVIDKLNQFGGCILADSVGLGKTFEALAVIKYHELRNDRVLVLVPKRLRDNWAIYTQNDSRNILAADRFNYDILNHTDLSRDKGLSGDIDLAHVNWGNYDLVVIDESHNFRNKKAPRLGSETRYDRLMRRIIKEGVKTRVLMLSATPVNNRLADLRNQIAFATEGNDAALVDQGIPSLDTTTRVAQTQFNRWLALPENERSPSHLIEMLGFDYFTLLDRLTIARSRKHIERYYGIAETGRFPTRLRPINIKADVDAHGDFPPIHDINVEIRRLNLAAHAPLRYVLAHRKEAYNKKYRVQVKDGRSYFRQVDREESLIHLMRVNLLKRMESAVPSFALTVERQLQGVEAMLKRIDQHLDTDSDDTIEELDITEVDLDDPAVESLLVGRKIKVLLQDVDRVRWRQDLLEDRHRLADLLDAGRLVLPDRDAKLIALREMIAAKCKDPINADNRKIIVFTAFADTAEYLYQHLAPWAGTALNIHSALVTGSRRQTTLANLPRDLSSILTAFSPRSKERPATFAAEGDIDLLIATDCISEGQNLQDCDWLINYDIHWNPVRIIQRFGRIDRIGSPNESIQLVNFWPNIELEEYINLEQRVSGRMVLLDISATGEENLIEQQSGDPMNDLEYRRKQLLKLQDSVIDIEDISAGLSIADLTLSGFRIELAAFEKVHPGLLATLPPGIMTVTTTAESDVPPGVIFCLRAANPQRIRNVDPTYPLAPWFMVHVADDGPVLLSYPQVRRLLDRLKRTCADRTTIDPAALLRHDQSTQDGDDTHHLQQLLANAIAAIAGKAEERATASLFSPGGTHAFQHEFGGISDFEVAAWVVILPEAAE